jgi:hypothetical protein
MFGMHHDFCPINSCTLGPALEQPNTRTNTGAVVVVTNGIAHDPVQVADNGASNTDVPLWQRPARVPGDC